MSLYTVSVIVPVYNVKEYIAECIESLIKQSLSNMQIIIVDDGSTDGSLEICKLYADKYSQIKLVPVEHSGVAVAQQIGLDLAEGKYIAFLGADDYVSPDMYKKMWDEAEAIQADIVECNYRLFWEDGTFRDSTNKYIAVKLKKNKNVFSGAGAEAILRNIGYAWRIHRRDFLLEKAFSFNAEISFGEDYIWHFFPIVFAGKYSMIDHVGYFYRQRSAGNQTNSSSKKLLDIEKAFVQADSYLAELPEKYFLNIYIQYEIRIVIFILDKLSEEDKNTFCNLLSKRWKKWENISRIPYFIRTDSWKIDIVEYILWFLRVCFLKNVVKGNTKKAQQLLILIKDLCAGGAFKKISRMICQRVMHMPGKRYE